VAACFGLFCATSVTAGCQRFGYESMSRASDAGGPPAATRQDGGTGKGGGASQPGAGAGAGGANGSIADGGRCDANTGDASRCDDGLACTRDEVLFEAGSCETVCAHAGIEALIAGDACCPAGADAATDSDCSSSSCGNGLIEPGEACDDDVRCFKTCLDALPASLVRRYSFEGTGDFAPDSLGGPDASIIGGILNGAGAVDLEGEFVGEHVALAADVLNGLSDATFEAWVIWRGSTITTQDPGESIEWERVFDFGQSVAGAGQSYLFFTPFSEEDLPGVGFKAKQAGSTEVFAVGVSPFPRDELAHLAVVFQDSGDLLSIYINGEHVASAATAGHLADIEAVNNWLGRSQFDDDRYFDGAIEEFRIYDAALSAQQLQSNYVHGPAP
jgi:hypothetical protein